jgi:hypothetical protein
MAIRHQQQFFTESMSTYMEAELVKMGWEKQQCGCWSDPLDHGHYPTHTAFRIAVQRRAYRNHDNLEGKLKALLDRMNLSSTRMRPNISDIHEKISKSLMKK